MPIQPRLPKPRISTLLASLMLLCWLILLSGCGPSGRDLSDANWLQLQQDMQAERAEVGRQRDLLESDRREWDERERREPVLAAVISSAALLIACGLPLLIVAGLLIQDPPADSAGEACNELLDQVVELTDAREPHRLEIDPTDP